MRFFSDCVWRLAGRLGWVGFLSSIFPVLVIAAGVGADLALANRSSTILDVDSYVVASDSAAEDWNGSR